MSSDVARTPDIVSVTSRFRVEPLTQAECGALQGATLRLRDDVGVHVPSTRALDVFADHEGARIDDVRSAQRPSRKADVGRMARIVATPRPEPLLADAASELARVLAAADREAERLT